MAIVNRDLDSSQQKEFHSVLTGVIATGVTVPLFRAPFPCTINQVHAAIQGVSGSPVWSLEVLRWGAGITGIVGLAATLTLAAVGNSQAPQGFSLVAAGSTLLNLNAGDVLVVRSGASNAAIAQSNVTVVLQALQDIKSFS